MKKKRILASGKFDILHPGHIHYLRESSKLAENTELYIVLAHEKNIEDCIFPKEARKMMLESVGYVDKVITGEADRNYRDVLEDVKPDIISLGYDQDEGPIRKALDKLGLDSEIRRVDSLKPEAYSSSQIKRRLRAEK